MLYETTVLTDEFTQAASTAFDYQFEGRSTFEGWVKPAVPETFGIGLILGPSGSGKSLLLREFGEEEKVFWDPSKAIVSHFETPQDSQSRLMAVGLNSIPSWCCPFNVLSNGEQFRANLARRLKNGAVVDEFTSVVDRNVAKAASVSVRRYVDRTGIKNLVLASCHYDILEWLRPDWCFDTRTGELHSGRLLRRPPIELRVYPCGRNLWSLFAKHHYLSANLNRTCRAFGATANFGDGETVVGFSSSLPLPHAHIRKGYREHRTVIFPDFQGLGLGARLSDLVAQFHVDEGKRYFSATAHPSFGAYRTAHPELWKPTSKNRKRRKEGNGDITSFGGDLRIKFSHEYIARPAPSRDHVRAVIKTSPL